MVGWVFLETPFTRNNRIKPIDRTRRVTNAASNLIRRRDHLPVTIKGHKVMATQIVFAMDIATRRMFRRAHIHTIVRALVVRHCATDVRLPTNSDTVRA